MRLPFAVRLFSLCAVAMAAAGAARADGTAVRRITLAESVDVALRQNPDIAAAKYEVDAAEAAHSSAVGNYGPRLKGDANIQVWDRALQFNLGGPPLTVRNQVTWTAGLTLAQPLSSLWTIYEGAKLREIGVNVAQIRRESTRRDTAFQVIEGYYRLLQAMRLEEVNAKSVEQIEAQVKRSEAFFRQGTVGKNDVLRAQLGLAAVRQKKIQASGMVTLARGRLAVLLGMPVGTALEPADVPTSAPARSLMTAEQAELQAVSRRVEIREINARIEQAEKAVGLAKSKMVPQVNAIANYAHAEGSIFQQKNAFFVGATASWDIWEWGATYHGIPEARARLAQAQAARTKAEDMLKLDARNSYVNVTTSAEALAVAEQAVVQAEENYRIESKRYEAANNTSFDVLDAETLLTNAKSQQQAALYDYIIAQSSLARATGEEPKVAANARASK